MNSNIYEYGTDPNTGLKRRLVRNSVVIQEETETNLKPKVVVHLRLQTYVEKEDSIVVVTDETAGYEVVKGKISYNVDNEALPKNEVNVETGVITTPMDPETNESYPRDNGYENIILLASLNRAFDSVLDNGIKEYYKIS
jgi:hypothetical protein|tara:strand:- start:82 stop:501 length:420 start_codon:yes stop_codon:yes gene_type:complete